MKTLIKIAICFIGAVALFCNVGIIKLIAIVAVLTFIFRKELKSMEKP